MATASPTNHNYTLFQFGALTFRVIPNSVQEYDHLTSTEFARKQVIGAVPQREWVGSGDEEIILHGILAPRMLGGFAQLELLDAARLKGDADTLIRGGQMGQMLGWFVCEHLERRHANLSGDGIGKTIRWTAVFSRCDEPDGKLYYLNNHKALSP